jgi:hypothetical protein
MAIHFPDETQGQVQLAIILPARAWAAGHLGQKLAADRGGRTDGDEQAVHER